MTTSPARPHLAYLDSLRALTALYVVLHHLMLTVIPTAKNVHGGAALLIVNLFRHGHYAVSLFIVLSGYSLMLPVTRNSGQMRDTVGRFYFKRARRILPPYYSALLLSLLACATVIGSKTGTLWDLSLPVTRDGVLSHLFLLQDIFYRFQINGPLWSIAVEWQIYFLFPLFVLWSQRQGTAKMALGLLPLSLLLFLAIRHTVLVGIMPAYIWLFALGMCACDISYGNLSHWREHPSLRYAPVALLPVFLGLLFKWRADPSAEQWFLLDCLAGLLFAAVLIAASQPGRLQKMLSYRPLAKLGLFAYSLYLMHMPLLQIVWQYGVGRLHLSLPMRFLVSMLVGVPLIVTACYGFFLVCEKPFLNTKLPK